MDALQKQRQQRGDDFQDELRRSWRFLPNCWRMRIADGKGASRPADEIILLEPVNILAEAKRTKGDSFQLSFLRANQIKGLLDFDKCLDRNLGLVFVSFLDEDRGIDEAYCIRLPTAMYYMKKAGRAHIKREELKNKVIPRLELLLIETMPRTYDLKGVNNCYRLL